MKNKQVELYKKVYNNKEYGNTSIKNLRYLLPQIKKLSPKTLLDYGCGRSKLADRLEESLDLVIYKYDPAINEFSNKPNVSVDLLINIDVLEHIPVTELDAFLTGMSSLSKDAIIVIDTKLAETILENGENAHCTIKSKKEWRLILSKYYDYIEPIKVTRNSRAAFRTWKLTRLEKVKVVFDTFIQVICYHTRKLFSNVSLL